MNKNKSDLGTLRRKNSALVLDVIRHFEPISRADIAKQTKLTPAAVSSIADELIACKIIQETGYSDENRVGRKAVMLNINSSKLHVISIGFNNEDIFFGMVNLKGQYQTVKIYEKLGEATPETIFPLMFKEIDSIIRNMEENDQQLLGLGIAFPGPVDLVSGKILHTGTFKNFQNYSILERLKTRYQFPICIENDADAAALAENWFGKRAEVNSLFFILLEKGIGSGFVIKGNLFRSQNHLSSEFGHMIVIPDGPLCHCGNFGCLETVASARAIAKESLELLEQRTSLQADTIEIDDIFNLILNDEQLSNKLFGKACTYLGMAIANVVNLLTPDIIVLGGILVDKLSNNFDLVNQLIAVVKLRIHPNFRDTVRIEASRLGRYAPLVGAASLIIKNVYNDPLSIKMTK
jgi:predicted NBD/HSP70 family sugar kinase